MKKTKKRPWLGHFYKNIFIFMRSVNKVSLQPNTLSREVVVAQLAERSLTIREDPSSNPVIGNFY